MQDPKPTKPEMETDFLAEDLLADFEYQDNAINQIDLPDRLWCEEIIDNI